MLKGLFTKDTVEVKYAISTKRYYIWLNKANGGKLILTARMTEKAAENYAAFVRRSLGIA